MQNIYKNVIAVYYVITNRKTASWPKGTQVLNMVEYDRKKLALRLSDWIINENQNPKHYTIKKGFIPGEVTNFKA